MKRRYATLIALLAAPLAALAAPAQMSVIATGLGGEPFNGPLRGLSLSPDGETVTFSSYATNVAAPDAGGPTINAEMRQWAVDVDSGALRLLGTGHFMSRSSSYASGGARISHDGRYAVFSVGSPEDYDAAVPSNTNERDLLVRLDLDTDTYVALPKALSGNYLQGDGVGVEYLETGVTVSPDGRYVTFRWSGPGVTVDQESNGGDFVWDVAAEAAFLLTSPELYAESNPFPPSVNLIFLENGWLLGSMPIAASGGLHVPVVWTTIGAPPVQHYGDGTVGLILQQATPDGRYLIVAEDISVGSTTFHIDTDTDVRTPLCMHPIFGTGSCVATGISDDGRFVLIGKRLTDLERDQTIQAVPAESWNPPLLIGDGTSFVTADPDGVILKRTHVETRVEIGIEMDSETVEVTEDDGSTSFEYYVEGVVTVTIAGAHPATNVAVQMFPERGSSGSGGSPTVSSDAADCISPLRCIVPVILPGETWTATLEWLDTLPLRHALTATFTADEQWLTEPVVKSHESEIEVEPGTAPTPEPTPIPTPTLPAVSSGGGALGWWWLLALVPAVARRRRAYN